MDFLANVLKFLDYKITTPTPYGLFHIVSCVLVVLLTVALCVTHKKGDMKRPQLVLTVVAIVVTVLEIYKQINYSFQYSDGIKFDFQWYAFPWQFCSMPMYVGLLASIIRKGKVHDSLCAFLATYSVFAGLSVMAYPNTVFIDTLGVDIQTMVCHGTMIVVGVYLLYSGKVKAELKTILKALPVFGVAVAMAAIMNEIAHLSGLLETETFNMFFISPYCEPSLPVYSLVQNVVPFPLCLVIYIIGFTIAATLVLLVAIAAKRLVANIADRRRHKTNV